ncbi:MAG: cohesin domain-containing protein [Saprospiraceae bacterium]
MKKIYIIALILSFAAVSFSQLEVNFSDAVASTPTSIVDVDITVSNWDQLIGVQFSVNWDPNVFEFSSIENVTTDLEEFSQGGNIGTPPSAQAINEGQMTVSWSLSSTLPASVADDTRLFTLRLQAVGNAGDETNLIISNIPRVTEILDANKQDPGVNTTGGELKIEGESNMDCVDIIIENLTAENGTNICVPIKVNRFTSIASVQTGLTWNSSILKFTGVNDGGLSGISTNDNNADNGELRLLWLIGLGDDPVTLDDGSTILEVCFDVIGSTGQSTNIRFESLPNFAIEIANGEGNAEEVCTDNGRFQVDGMAQPENGVGLIAGCVATNGASTICVPVTTKNFNSIASIQSGVNWDPSIITFTGITDRAIEGITVNAAAAAMGELRLLWIIGLGEDPKTVADDAVLFEMCFDVIGMNGDESSVGFLSLPNFAVEIANGGGMSEEFFTRLGKVKIGNDDDGGGPQNGVGLIAGDVCTEGATSICVPVTTRSFKNIASIQSGLTWDPSILSFTGIEEKGLEGVTVNAGTADMGQLRLLWIIGLGSDPLTLADDEVLFDICFDVVGNDGDISVVGFMDLPNFAIEIANGNGMSEEFFIDNGSATLGVDCPDMTPGNCPDGLGTSLGLFVQNTTVVEGEEVCVAVQVGNFNDVQSMQFTIEWDESVIEYVRQDNFGLTDLGNANFNFISPNKLRVSWTPLSSSGALDDCTTIFEVCFNGIGSCTQMESSSVLIVSDGNVLVEITDSNNDVLDVDLFGGGVTIEECTEDPQITIDELTNITCPGDMDGAVVVTVMGTGGVTCQWTSSDGTVVGSDCNISMIGEGTYTLTATNGEGNTSTKEVTIASPDTIIISVDITDRDCDTESAFTVNASGGTSANGTYTYSYMSSVELGDMASHTAIPGGDYTVVVIDDNGCSMSRSFTVLDSSIIVDSQVAGVSSMDGNDGGIIIAAKSSGGDVTYAWDDGFAEADRQGLSPGTYTVTITDEAGCSSVRVFEVDWEAVFVTDIVMESSGRFNGFGISCPGDDNGMISGIIKGGCNDGPVMVSINGEVITLPITVTEGTYMILATDACGNTDQQMIDIRPPDPLSLGERDLQDGCASIGGSNGSIQLGGILTGGAGEYIITSSEGTVDGTLIEGLAEGTITISVEDVNGCQALFEDIVVETCDGPLDCKATPIISPNGDGKNDIFVFDCLMRRGIEPNKLGVYNRWGELVFEAENYDNSWAGTDMTGNLLNEGGYMWILKVSRPDQPIDLFRGTVTLLRSN